jgi:hypothetical protein
LPAALLRQGFLFAGAAKSATEKIRFLLLIWLKIWLTNGKADARDQVGKLKKIVS